MATSSSSFSMAELCTTLERMRSTQDETPLWTPTPERRAGSPLTAYMEWLARDKGLRFDGYDALWRWSVAEPEAFWESVWQHFEVRASRPYASVLAARRMPGARWFEGARDRES